MFTLLGFFCFHIATELIMQLWEYRRWTCLFLYRARQKIGGSGMVLSRLVCFQWANLENKWTTLILTDYFLLHNGVGLVIFLLSNLTWFSSWLYMNKWKLKTFPMPTWKKTVLVCLGVFVLGDNKIGMAYEYAYKLWRNKLTMYCSTGLHFVFSYYHTSTF